MFTMSSIICLSYGPDEDGIYKLYPLLNCKINYLIINAKHYFILLKSNKLVVADKNWVDTKEILSSRILI